MKTNIAIIAAIALIALSAASCEKQQQASTEKPPLVKGVQVEQIALSPVDDYYEATGTVRSKTTTQISARIIGVVTALRAREGDHVRAGQSLIEIDNRDAQTQLQKANAGLREAQEALVEVEQSINAAQSAKAAAEANKRLAAATLARYQILLERRSVSPQEFDEVKAKHQVAEAEADRAEKVLQMLAAKKSQTAARVDQAKAEIANAQISAGYARITAPANGVVTARSIEVGATATPGAPLLTIEDDANYRLEAAVEESQLGRIRLNDAALVRIDALGNEELTGKVAEIVPAADPASRSYTVKIALPARRMLRSGLYGVARFMTGQKQVILVPRKSVVQRGQLTGVFAVDSNGIARLRLIKPGKSYGDRVEVLSGIGEGERIVVDGVANVNDGSRVQ
jgi:multidrug efflux pump subunit AcrA (membrane-fusion protein)